MQDVPKTKGIECTADIYGTVGHAGTDTLREIA